MKESKTATSVAAVSFFGGEDLRICKNDNIYLIYTVCVCMVCDIMRGYDIISRHFTGDIGYEVTSPDPGTRGKSSGEDELGHR